jgi:hypothetical protein
MTGSSPGAVELTELVAGVWQLRPWPAAHADLDDVLVELGPADGIAAERVARLEGWARGDLLGFAVRDITTGASVAEVLVIVTPNRHASVAMRTRPAHLGARIDGAVEDVVRRWATGALGLTVS